MRTCAFGRVEGEHVWSRVLIGYTCNRIHQSLGENLGFSLFLIDDHHHTVSLFHGCSDTLADALFVVIANCKFIDDDLDVVVLISVHLHSPFEFHDFPIYPHM